MTPPFIGDDRSRSRDEKTPGSPQPGVFFRLAFIVCYCFRVLTVALWINIAFLVVMSAAMVWGGQWTVRALGTLTPARSILLAVYLAFLATSVLFVVWPLEPGIITLLAIQIAYTVLSAFTVRVLTNPLVIGNLLLACFHIAALVIHSMPA